MSRTLISAADSLRRGWREFNLCPGAWIDGRIIAAMNAFDERKRRLR